MKLRSVETVTTYELELTGSEAGRILDELNFLTYHTDYLKDCGGLKALRNQLMEMK